MAGINMTGKRWLVAVLAGLVALAWMGWWSAHRTPRSPWKTATVPYDAKCEGECLKTLKPVAGLDTPHLKGVKILWRPDIDDAIAQLGDCLDSIMACVNELGGDPSRTAECVARAEKCPAACRDAYAARFNASMTAEQQMDGVDAIFLADDGVCAPREPAP